jgi:drug/metabolite transporter (DMT)-like permease
MPDTLMARTLPCRFALLTCLAMLAFAGNSVLCRLALRDTDIDPASFTAIRLLSGAITLWLLLALRRSGQSIGGDWRSALALFIYAGAFSLAYVHLQAGAGALLLFGAVQLTMTGWGLLRGERMKPLQSLGLVLAVAGLLILLLPGADAPPWLGAGLMVVSGFAWGIYSLLGRGAGDPLATTAGNFVRAVPFALLLLLPFVGALNVDAPGLVYALLSGALTSGIGYALWYSALKGLTAIQGASVQLSVPIIAALGGALLLGESITLRLVLVAVMTLGGIALVVWGRAKPQE